MASNIVFLEQWKDELLNDEFAPLNEEEVAYMMYAAAIYCWTGEKTNFKEIFDRVDLNRIMAPYYSQIDSILNYRENMRNNIRGRQSLDKEEIKKLASRGFTQRQICEELGYDVDKLKSISSNPGWKEGRAIYIASSHTENVQKVQNVQKWVQKVTETPTEKVQKVTESTENYSSVKESDVFDF